MINFIRNNSYNLVSISILQRGSPNYEKFQQTNIFVRQADLKFLISWLDETEKKVFVIEIQK